MNKTGFFNIYSTGDPEGKNTAISLLSTMIISAIVSLPVIILLRLIYDFKLYTTDIVLIILIPLFYSLYFLLKKGKLVLTSVLFLLIALAAMTVMAASGDGIRDITVTGYILIIFLAVLIAGYKIAILLTAATIILVWFMAGAEANNILLPPDEEPLVYARDFTIMIFLTLTGNLLYERSFRYSFNRINGELDERKKAEERLSQNERRLLVQNEELRAAKLKAEESERLKTAFLQNISHEIRTPMNGIVGFAELLKEPELSAEKSSEYTEFMMNCSDQLAGVINDLIDISKIEAGAMDLNISVFKPETLFNDLRILFEAPALAKGINLTLRNELHGKLIKSDRGKITRILNNLVGNAVKFTPQGEVVVHAFREDSNIIISVADTGIGIHEEEIEHIFDRFRQSESGMTRSFEGSGLGLAICKGNLDYLGGNICVKSEIRRGSCFTVTLPVEFPDSDVTESSVRSELRESRGIKILVAEDDEISYLYLINILKNENCEIVRTQSGKEVLDKFINNPGYDLILMDLKLPELSGFEAARRIREIDKSVPIIAISAYAFEEDKKRASECGIDDYLSKPFYKTDLIDKINRSLNRES